MKGEGRQRERKRETESEAEACVAVVTGTLHYNDFNRSSDTHAHKFLHTEKLVGDKLSVDDEEEESEGAEERKRIMK